MERYCERKITLILRFVIVRVEGKIERARGSKAAEITCYKETKVY
jgi:hypothetical protein